MTMINNDALACLPTFDALPTAAIVEQTIRLKSSDGLNLHLHSWQGAAQPDKIMLVVHGMGGHGAYYTASLAPYLVPARTFLYALDLRGHGKSDGVRGDIVTFEHFQRDLRAAVLHLRELHPNLPLFMLAESMGTSIAINYAATAAGPARPDFLALIACVIAPTLKPRPDEIVRTLYYCMRDRQRVALPITGREEQGIRDTAFIQVLKTDELFNRKVSVRFLSGMTLHMRRAARSHQKLTMPLFAAQGGKDITVNHRRTRAFFGRIAAPDKELHYFPDAFHAILNDPESPTVRQLLLTWMERQRIAFTPTHPTDL